MFLAFVKARLALSSDWRELEAKRRANTRKELLVMFEALDRAGFSSTRASWDARVAAIVEERLDRVLSAAFPLDDVLEVAAKLQGG